MSGSRWVITRSWLSGSWRSFLYSSFVYSCHIFLTSSASVRSIPFLSFIEPISNFLEEISSLSHSIVFLYFFVLIAGGGFLISACYSLEFCSQTGISFLFSFAFSFSFLIYLCLSSNVERRPGFSSSLLGSASRGRQRETAQCFLRASGPPSMPQ